MKFTASRIPGVVILFAAIATGGSLTAWSEQSTPAPDVLTALLTEVRGLRAAMERMASAGPQVQLALGRLQLQEQRIMNQVRRLDQVRASLVAAQRELDPLTQRVKDETESVNAADEPDVRRGREGQLAEAKRLWSVQNVEVQRLTAEEAMLAQDLAAEQNRWTDFNQRLEELERALERR
jgi:chromosome segregation ATPase